MKSARPSSSSKTAATRDTGMRKAANKHLARIDNRYHGLLEAAPDAMVVVDQDGKIVLVNLQAEKQFGYHRNELLGQKVTSIIPEGFAERLVADGLRSAEDALAQQIGTGIELVARRKDASEFPIELMLSPLKSNGSVLVTAAIRNITARLNTEEQLRQAQKMEAIGNLTGGMAHDVNNMLGIIIGNLDLAGPLIADNAEVAELIHEAIEAALSGAKLTQRLLAFARQQPLCPERIAPNELVTGIVRLLRRALGESIEIELDLAPDLWPVIADPAQLESSLTNLANNARDAMSAGGKLTITTANRQLNADYALGHVEVTPGDYAVIEVTDTGLGMTREVAERIFEPFYTTKELGKGTGLGLSMVFGFIKQSGGHISVYSEPRIGTTFRLYLPRASEKDRTMAGMEPAPPPRGSGEGVLAVEDNPRLRRVVMRQLAELGYRPVEADGPTAALAILETEKIDLLFTDVVMPGPIDGITLARQALERWPTIKVVLTSGFPGTKPGDQLGPPAPAVRLLSKPYRVEDLATVLHQVLDS